MEICCIDEKDIEEKSAREIRKLLFTCFPYEFNFQSRLYSNEKPNCHFVVYQASRIIAHSAVHKKKMLSSRGVEYFIGIADVCVDPGYRMQGIARSLLEYIEKSYQEDQVFILLGSLIYYRSGGYKKVPNIYFTGNPDEPNEFALIKIKPGFVWPEKEKVFIEGLPF